MRTTAVFGFVGALLAFAACAGTLTNSQDAYSLEFGSGWTLDRSERQFSVSHSDGSSFTGLKAELPPNVKSVKVAGLMLQATALAAGLCGKDTAEFELSGPGWTGAGFQCNDRPGARNAQSQTIGLAVKHGESFFQFMLFVPRQDWTTQSASYLALLRSLRFREQRS
jgi:hypothetical protein